MSAPTAHSPLPADHDAAATGAGTPHHDVVIVGAGLSGIGAAYRLQESHPGRSYTILEGRQAIGGTWDLFRYPGVRSDSDMFTLGYPFRPWRTPKAIATGPEIRDYIRDTAREFVIDRRIEYGTKVVAAQWDSTAQRWTLATEVTDEAGESTRHTRTCSFLYLCSGYYRYDATYQPVFPGIEDFAGQVVHPQFWPEDLDWAGKRVVVIGSGATAMTVVPAMAETAAIVTMLQRSPTYVISQPAEEVVVRALQQRLPAKAAARVARTKSVAVNSTLYQLSRRRPGLVKRMLRAGNVQGLGDERLVDEHFTPRYNPWDQRLCLIPGGDLYEAITSGRAKIVTDTINTFVPEGIRTTSGQLIEADIVVTATGLEMLALGGIDVSVDGEPVDLAHAFVYRGVMLSGVPNAAMCVGYTNASWTLRADLASRYVCRLLAYMDRHGYAVAVPTPSGRMEERPLLPLDAGYIHRAEGAFPKQGTKAPWQMHQNYARDLVMMRTADVGAGMAFAPPRHTS
ncbi:flavin-containing monooxygenase [Actinomycetota bacterium]